MDDRKRYLVLDGGFATEASVHGHQLINDDPLWSARLLDKHTDIIKLVHKSYLESGADIIETSSYQASVQGLVKHMGLSADQAYQLIVTSGGIATEVRDQFWDDKANRKDRQRPLVAGSVGPYGACQHDASEYTGNYVDHLSIQDLEEWHRPQVRAQVESGVDLVAFDTVPAVNEARAIINVLREFPNTKAWISFSCKDSEHTCHGETLQEAAALVTQSDDIIAVGMNCLPPQNVCTLLQHIPDVVKVTKNIVVYPNSGEKWSVDKKWTGKADCVPLRDYVPRWLEGGATWIGGCCRVSPSDVSGIRTAMDEYTCRTKQYTQ